MKQLLFRQAFELALCGQKVRASEWSKEYYLTFSEGELWFSNGVITRIIPIRELNVWRQLYKQWEIKV